MKNERVNRTQTYPPELLVTKNILTDRTDHVIVSVEVNVALLVRHRAQLSGHRVAVDRRWRVHVSRL